MGEHGKVKNVSTLHKVFTVISQMLKAIEIVFPRE